MKRTLILLAVAAAMSLFPVQAKADDAGAWLTLQANKGWQNSYAFLRLEHRSNEMFSATDAWFTSLGAGYKFAPWFKGDVSYELWNVASSFYVHKAVFSGTATLAREGLAVSLKEKLEIAVNPSASSTGFTLRSRLRAQYTIPGSRVTPYAMAEVFNWTSWIRSLNYGGCEIALDKHNVIDVFYMYHIPAGQQSEHVLGLAYYFNF